MIDQFREVYVMNCPVCKSRSLSVEEIEPNLKGLICKNCRGQWIHSYQYWKWHEKFSKSIPEKPYDSDDKLPVQDSTTAKICPECRHILIHFPVGHELDFTIERCANCGGMWFDNNEWQALKQKNLHDDVHLIFSAIWQSQIRKESHRKSMEEFYREKFGPQDFRKITEIKHWLQNHSCRSELLAFLQESE